MDSKNYKTNKLINCSIFLVINLNFLFIIISRWAILCLKWHFTTRRLRNESLAETPIEKNKDNHSTPTQLAAWGIPALQTVAVLVARFVDADELLGILNFFK